MRRRQSFNPFQVGDYVVIRKGMLDGFVGQVLAREEGGRVLIAVECGSAKVLIRVPYRHVEQNASGGNKPRQN
jgi:hypothetical protein